MDLNWLAAWIIIITGRVVLAWTSAIAPTFDRGFLLWHRPSLWRPCQLFFVGGPLSRISLSLFVFIILWLRRERRCGYTLIVHGVADIYGKSRFIFVFYLYFAMCSPVLQILSYIRSWDNCQLLTSVKDFLHFLLVSKDMYALLWWCDSKVSSFTGWTVLAQMSWALLDYNLPTTVFSTSPSLICHHWRTISRTSARRQSRSTHIRIIILSVRILEPVEILVAGVQLQISRVRMLLSIQGFA